MSVCRNKINPQKEREEWHHKTQNILPGVDLRTILSSRQHKPLGVQKACECLLLNRSRDPGRVDQFFKNCFEKGGSIKVCPKIDPGSDTSGSVVSFSAVASPSTCMIDSCSFIHTVYTASHNQVPSFHFLLPSSNPPSSSSLLTLRAHLLAQHLLQSVLLNKLYL